MAGTTSFLSSKAIREVAKALTDRGFFGVPRYTTALLPPIPGEGAIAFDTTTDTFKGFDGASWAALGGGGGLTIGTTAVTGGEDSVLYVDGGILRGDSTILGFNGTNLSIASLTASRLLVTDASKNLASNGSLTTNVIPKSASSGASLAASALSDDGTNVTSSEPILLPVGAVGAPGLDVGGSGVNGLFGGTQQVNTTSNGVCLLSIDANRGGIVFNKDYRVGFCDNANAHLGSYDAVFSRAAAFVIGMNIAGTIPTWLQMTPGRKRLVSTVTNTTTTMANLTELSVDLIAGRKYTFKLILFVENSLATDGVKVDFEGGTATMTSFRAHGLIFDAALLLSLQSTALATDFAAATITGASKIEIDGGFVCNAGGTFIPRQAMVTAVSGTLSTYLNSYLWVEDMPA